MSGLTHTTETMTLHHALETFTLARADNVDEAALLEEVNCQCRAKARGCLKRFELSTK